jgi:hypothetical protein
MRIVLQVISYLALGLLVGAPVMFYAGSITLQTNKTLMLIATVVWFASALGWVGRKTAADEGA